MNFLSLPEDILYRLVVFLSPIDLVKLRRTCRFLDSIIHDEHTWRIALKTACAQNDVPLATYDLATMELKDLVDAVCLPHRFQRGLEGQKRMRAPRKHTLNLSVTKAENEARVGFQSRGPGINSLEAVPGGRYLVSGEGNGWLRFWDLGPELSGRIDPKLSLHLAAPIAGIWMQRSIRSASIIVIAAVTETYTADLVSVHVHIVELTIASVEGERAFQTVAESVLPDYNLWILEGDYFIIVDTQLQIRIFNWKLGKWGHVHDPANAPDPSSSRAGLSNFMSSGSHIVLFQESPAGIYYRLYGMPKLHDTQGIAEAHKENTLLQAALFAPGGLDVDIPLPWRPATMYSPADAQFTTISTVPFVVVTLPSATHLFVMRDFLPSTMFNILKPPGSDLPLETIQHLPEYLRAESLFPYPHISLPYMKKRHFSDHVRIHSGFDSAFLVFIDPSNRWRVLTTPLSMHTPDPAPAAVERRLGTEPDSDKSLCLSVMRGTALFMSRHDRSEGRVSVWEYCTSGVGGEEDLEEELDLSDGTESDPGGDINIAVGLDLDAEFDMEVDDQEPF